MAGAEPGGGLTQLSDGVADLAAALDALPAKPGRMPGARRRTQRALADLREALTAYAAEYATVAARHEELARNARHLIATIGAPVADLDLPRLTPTGDAIDRRDIRRLVTLLDSAVGAATRRERQALAVGLAALHDAGRALVDDFRSVVLVELDQLEALVARLLADRGGRARLRAVPRDDRGAR